MAVERQEPTGLVGQEVHGVIDQFFGQSSFTRARGH